MNIEEGRANPADNAWAKPPKEVEYVERGLRATLRRNWKITTPVGLILFTWFMWWGFQPIRGTIHIGICRTFIETRIRYPGTLKLTAWEWFIANGLNGLRLYYTYTDDFGQNRSEMMECDFNMDGRTLADVQLDRKSLPPEEVKAYNQTIPFVIGANPDLVIPPPPTDDLEKLKRDNY